MPLYTRATAHLAGPAGFEPQRQNNWGFEVNIPGADPDTVALSLVRGFLPTNYNEEIPIPYGNEVVYVAGRSIWEPGGLICRDWVDRACAKAFLDWRVQVFNPQDGSIGFAADYKRDASIILFPPNYDESSQARGGQFQRVWTLHGCWPVRVNAAANDLDQTSSGQVMMEIALRYDRATADYITYERTGANSGILDTSLT